MVCYKLSGKAAILFSPWNTSCGLLEVCQSWRRPIATGASSDGLQFLPDTACQQCS